MKSTRKQTVFFERHDSEKLNIILQLLVLGKLPTFAISHYFNIEEIEELKITVPHYYNDINNAFTHNSSLNSEYELAKKCKKDHYYQSFELQPIILDSLNYQKSAFVAEKILGLKSDSNLWKFDIAFQKEVCEKLPYYFDKYEKRFIRQSLTPQDLDVKVAVIVNKNNNLLNYEIY